MIEVKATAQPDWVVPGKTPDSGPKPWVFVRIPADEKLSPEFFVLTQTHCTTCLRPSRQSTANDTARRMGAKLPESASQRFR